MKRMKQMFFYWYSFQDVISECISPFPKCKLCTSCNSLILCTLTSCIASKVQKITKTGYYYINFSGVILFLQIQNPRTSNNELVALTV